MKSDPILGSYFKKNSTPYAVEFKKKFDPLRGQIIIFLACPFMLISGLSSYTNWKNGQNKIKISYFPVFWHFLVEFYY